MTMALLLMTSSAGWLWLCPFILLPLVIGRSGVLSRLIDRLRLRWRLHAIARQVRRWERQESQQRAIVIGLWLP